MVIITIPYQLLYYYTPVYVNSDRHCIPHCHCTTIPTAVNVFVHADLDKTVFMHMLPEYKKNGMVLHLNKAFYDLQWFSFLWQQKLTKKIEKLGFKTIPQELYMVQKDGIIGFFYVDNIVFIYKKDWANKVKCIRELLQQRLMIKKISKLK